MKNAHTSYENVSAGTAQSYTAIAAIRKALKRGEKINSLEALRRFGCFRLAAVVHILIHREGLSIKAERVNVRKANGKIARVAEYRLSRVRV